MVDSARFFKASRRFFASVVVIACTAGVVSCAEQPSESDGPSIVWAHRGASKQEPEQVRPAFERAIRDGADVLEFDVAQTSDGQLVVVHDDTLERTTNVKELFPDRIPWNVGDFSMEEISQLDAGSWWHPDYAGEKILTFREVIEIADGRVGIAPEIKNPERYPGIVENFADELEYWGYTDGASLAENGAPQVWVQSFSEPALRELGGLLPDVPLVALAHHGAYIFGTDDVLRGVAEWADAILANPVLTQAEHVERAQSYGLAVVSDVVDSPDSVQLAIEQGYDVLTSNAPIIARNALDGVGASMPTGEIIIDSVIYDPPGDDVLIDGGEYVVLRNSGTVAVSLTGYTVRDFANNQLRTGGDVVLQPGDTYALYVAAGSNRPDAHFNGLLKAVFNNTVGDHVYLYDDAGLLIDVFSYIV